MIKKTLTIFLFCLTVEAPGTACFLLKTIDSTFLEQTRAPEVQALLTSSGHFYFELHIQDKTLNLCHSGVTLRSYGIRRIDSGFKKIFFISRHKSKPFIAKIWENGLLYPPLTMNRIKIIPGDASTQPTPETPGLIPPTMEDLIPVPRSFQLTFNDQLRIRVDLKGKIPGPSKTGRGIKGRIQDYFQALGFVKACEVNIRLEMDADQGAAFYRSFPERAFFVALP